MAFRSISSHAAGDYTTADIPVPASAASGDIVVVSLYVDLWGTTMTTVTPPANFTLKYEDEYEGIYNIRHYWKRLTASDSGTYDFELSAERWGFALATAFSGRIATGDPFGDTDFGYVTGTTAFTDLSATAVGGEDALEFLTGYANAYVTEDVDWTERAWVHQAQIASIDNVSAGEVTDTTSTFGTSGELFNRIMLLKVAVSTCSVSQVGADILVEWA